MHSGQCVLYIQKIENTHFFDIDHIYIDQRVNTTSKTYISKIIKIFNNKTSNIYFLYYNSPYRIDIEHAQCLKQEIHQGPFILISP